MQNPNPVNLTTSAEIEAAGWVAEARDADGHLASTLAWFDSGTTNENLKDLGEFVAQYETDRTVTVFTKNLTEKLQS